MERWHRLVLLLALVTLSSAELLPSLDLKPSGWLTFTNETKTKTDRNIFSLYVKVGEAVQERQHIISIRSQTRTEQFIKVSLIQMQLSVLANLRHPAVSRWFLVGDKFLPNEVYYVKINQTGTELQITINNKTITENLESVEKFIFPAVIAIGYAETAPGINGSLAGVMYNGVSTLHSYLRRDDDFRRVAVEMGGEVTVKERNWITIDERNRKYCPHTNHFPKSEVGTEIKITSCQQGIARAVCGPNQIWLIEKCGANEKSPKSWSGDNNGDRNGKKGGTFSTNNLIIYIGCGSAGILLVTTIIIILLVRRNKRHRVHRYKMAGYKDDYNNFPAAAGAAGAGPRLQGVNTLPLKHDSLTTKNHLRNSLEMSCSTLDNAAADIMDNRIPVFTATSNPLNNKPEQDLYPVYMSSDNNLDRERDSDIISTILGERAERNYNNGYNCSTNLIPSSLLNSNSGLNSEASWQDV